MKAEIITIGDEILIGQITDTNSAWLADQFSKNGIETYQVTSVHDAREHILNAITNAANNVDLVVITGGLGPTKDDITKGVLCEYFNTELFFHEPTLEHIKKRFGRRGIAINKLNRGQAMLPKNCTILPNELGTAPGMWFEKNDTIFVSMPGVPFEMKYITEHELLPKLLETGRTTAIFHKTILTQGIPESMLAERIAKWEEALPDFIKLAYLPSPMAVRLRLSAKGENMEVLKQQVVQEVDKLIPLISESIYGYDNETFSEVIGRMLKIQGKKLAVAESCTGGCISHLITAVPGCSEYYNGSVTSYSNQAKENVLGVFHDTLEEYGAVSKAVAIQMAEGVKTVLNADYSVSTTGIAGPSGGTDEKPVGTVWIAVSGPTKTCAEKFVFVGDERERNITRAAQTAMQMLRRLVLEEGGK